jgi:hypothetical protein
MINDPSALTFALSLTSASIKAHKLKIPLFLVASPLFPPSPRLRTERHVQMPNHDLSITGHFEHMSQRPHSNGYGGRKELDGRKNSISLSSLLPKLIKK